MLSTFLINCVHACRLSNTVNEATSESSTFASMSETTTLGWNCHLQKFDRLLVVNRLAILGNVVLVSLCCLQFGVKSKVSYHLYAWKETCTSYEAAAAISSCENLAV